MTKYIKNHTKYIMEQLQLNAITEDLLNYHRLQIVNIQHERLIHLIVLCLFTLLLVGSFAFFFFITSFASLILLAIFSVIEVFYVLHYYLLENSIQQWYRLENDMISALKSIGENFSA